MTISDDKLLYENDFFIGKTMNNETIDKIDDANMPSKFD